jgi:hypothetical protein
MATYTVNCPCCAGAPCACCRTIAATLSCFTADPSCNFGIDCGHAMWLRSGCCDEGGAEAWAHHSPVGTPSDWVIETDPEDATLWRFWSLSEEIVIHAPKFGLPNGVGSTERNRCPEEIPAAEWTTTIGTCELLTIGCTMPTYIPFWPCGTSSGDVPAYVYTVNPPCCCDPDIFPTPPAFLRYEEVCYYAGAEVERACPWDVPDLPCKRHPSKCPGGYEEVDSCEECAPSPCTCPGDTGIGAVTATAFSDPSLYKDFTAVGNPPGPFGYGEDDLTIGATTCGYQSSPYPLNGEYASHVRIHWAEDVRAYILSEMEFMGNPFGASDWPEECGFVVQINVLRGPPDDFAATWAAGYRIGVSTYYGTYEMTKKELPSMPDSVTVFP